MLVEEITQILRESPSVRLIKSRSVDFFLSFVIEAFEGQAAIMQERRFELLGECHSWFDERRRGEEWLLECFRNHNSRTTTTKYASKPGMYKYPEDIEQVRKLMLWPIPLEEITNNMSISQEDQNIGW